jgi:hypothetical protein
MLTATDQHAVLKTKGQKNLQNWKESITLNTYSNLTYILCCTYLNLINILHFTYSNLIYSGPPLYEPLGLRTFRFTNRAVCCFWPPFTNPIRFKNPIFFYFRTKMPRETCNHSEVLQTKEVDWRRSWNFRSEVSSTVDAKR